MIIVRIISLCVFFLTAFVSFGQGTKISIYENQNESVFLVVYSSPMICRKNFAVDIVFPQGLRKSDEWLFWTLNYKDCNHNIKKIQMSTPIGAFCPRSSEFLSVIQSGASNQIIGEHTVIEPQSEFFDVDIILGVSEVRIQKGNSLSEGKGNDNYYGKDNILEFGIYRKDNPALTLDYMANVAGYTTFFFTYKHQSSEQLEQRIWLEDYRVVDLETGEVYYATFTDLPGEQNPRIVYNGTQTRFLIQFERLPKRLTKFSLMEGECAENSFCFQNLQIHDYAEATDFDFELYNNTAKEGTITFYVNQKRIGAVNIYIEGYYFGQLTEYFTDPNFVPSCGIESKANLSVRLPVGTYNYTASSSNLKWEGQFTITDNGCINYRLWR
jgi:hypothetical protein